MFPRTLVIVLFLAAQTALLGWLVARDRTPASHFAWTTVVPAPPPRVPSTPPVPARCLPRSDATPPSPPIAPPATIRPSCPPMRTDAPSGKLDLPHGVNHVTTSWTNAGWLAAWDEQHVLVSTDGGLSFTQMLDGPGTVDDVTFDCFGHPIVMRGGAIGIRDRDREQWRTVPGFRTDDDAPAALIGGGPDVLVIGISNKDTWHASVAVSADLGSTWWYRDLVDYWEQSNATGYQAADGTINIAITTADCMNDPTTVVRISPDGKVTRDEIGDRGRVRLYDGFMITQHDGLTWKRFGAPENAWVWLGDDANRDVDAPYGGGLPLADGPLPRVIDDERIMVVGKDMYARALRPWKYDNATVDRAGRLWAIDETRDGEDAWLVMEPGTRAKIPPRKTYSGNE